VAADDPALQAPADKQRIVDVPYYGVNLERFVYGQPRILDLQLRFGSTNRERRWCGKTQIIKFGGACLNMLDKLRDVLEHKIRLPKAC
jgi:hypothetical protein